MFAAGYAAANGNKVVLIEKNEKLGKKLFITGKGRCNVTNACSQQELIENTFGNPYFLYSAFYSFSNADLMNFFEENGVKLKVERGLRVFPDSEKSSDIIKALERFLNKNKVEIMLNTEVKEIIYKDKLAKRIVTDKKTFEPDAVIIACGGLSYPSTGSTGDGYKFAAAAGHSVTKLYPSLVALKAKESFCGELQGLTLKNIGIKATVDGKVVFKDFGEMMFTHFGITGPVVLSLSRYVTDKLDKRCEAVIDLKPALSEKELENRILRDFKKYINKAFKNALDDLLPKKLIAVVIKLSGIAPDKKVNEITKEERKKLCSVFKGFKITITDTAGYNEAVITAGGVCVDEIDPSSMRSKIINNLYFAGEVIDVDAFTGGFNLQIAFSTGYLAGNNV